MVTTLEEGEILRRYATFSYLGTGAQGNITAPRGSWFDAWVELRIGVDLRISYHVLPETDLVILL